MTVEQFFVLLFFGLVYGQEELANPNCNHWLDPGDCNNFTVKWYYDRYDHRCRRFHHSGCGGNSNNFNSLEECSATCTYVPPSSADRCSLPHEPGHCNSDIERWFFDWQKKQCVCSYWTGCGGNSNLFYSYNHCMEICGEFSHPWIGPGIDEKYWGVLNKSTMSPESQALFVNKPDFTYRSNAWWNPANNHASAGSAQNQQPYQQPQWEPQQPEYPHSQPPSPQDPQLQQPYYPQEPQYQSEGSQVFPEFTVDSDYLNNDYREMTASETRAEVPLFARGAKTVTVEKAIPEISIPPRKWIKKTRKQKVPPRQINPADEGTSTPAPTVPQATFSYTYHTDSRGNQITPTRETYVAPVRNNSAYERYTEQRRQYQNPRYTAPTPSPVLPTQFYVTYKTDQFGRQVWNQKIWWTGDGPMPIQALRSRYPFWLPPPYDGFGKNPYEDYDKLQDNRRWSTVPAVAPTASPTTSSITSSTTSTTTTTTTPAPSTTTTTTTAVPPSTTAQAYYTAPPPLNVWTTLGPRPTTQPVAATTTVPIWVRRYPPTAVLTKPWWYTTTAAAPSTTSRPPTPEPTLRQFVRQPPSYKQATDLTPHHFDRPLIQDMSTRPVYTTPRSFTPVRTATAEPIDYHRHLVQRITTEKPELSIDDIIALDEETYDDYDMQMEPDAQEDGQQPAVPQQRQRQHATPHVQQQRRPAAAPRNDAWKPIVMPPPSQKENLGKDYANTVDFEIQSHGDT